MSIIVYADESGIAKDDVVVIAGYAAQSDDWQSFSKRWNAILKQYGTDSFHFREWASASAIVRNRRKPESSYEKNKYKGWDLTKLDAFLNELSKLASDQDKIHFCGIVDSRKFNQGQNKLEIKNLGISHDGSAHKYCMIRFFAKLLEKWLKKWPDSTEDVRFIFDDTSDWEWKNAVLDVHKFFKQKISCFGRIAFERDAEHVPLQLADLLAGRTHQIAVAQIKGNPPKPLSKMDKDIYLSFGIDYYEKD